MLVTCISQHISPDTRSIDKKDALHRRISMQFRKEIRYSFAVSNNALVKVILHRVTSFHITFPRRRVPMMRYLVLENDAEETHRHRPHCPLALQHCWCPTWYPANIAKFSQACNVANTRYVYEVRDYQSI